MSTRVSQRRRNELTPLLTRAQELARRLSEQAAAAQSQARTAVELANAVRERAARHRRSAERHEEAARRHDRAQRRWAARGESERAEFDRRSADLERDSAQLERERAAHEEEHGWEPSRPEGTLFAPSGASHGMRVRVAYQFPAGAEVGYAERAPDEGSTFERRGRMWHVERVDADRSGGYIVRLRPAGVRAATRARYEHRRREFLA